MTRLEIKPVLKKYDLTRLFGGGRTSRFSHSLRTKIKKLEHLFTKLLKPVLYYQRKRIVSIHRGSIHLEGGITLSSPKLSKTMNGCEEIVCFVGTLGHGVEEKIRTLMGKNNLSEAYILDAMGSVAMESIVEKFHRQMINRYALKDKGITLPFSPGYCDWPLTEQLKLFDLFDSTDLGVKLNDSCLMKPRKSVSGVFGVTPSHCSIPFHALNPCTRCAKQDCIARREGTEDVYSQSIQKGYTNESAKRFARGTI
ncbi:MAG: hypothetical protein ISS66_03525 [Desulfobacteraceae bacterium]|nr:hypothetical protein [Desulfobacteraceae bacterium]